MTASNGFIRNVNTVVDKISIIESANTIFDEGVIPVLEEIAAIDLDEAILDLVKGDYLGNRKIDIDLALNVPGITREAIQNDIRNNLSVTARLIEDLGDSLPKYSSLTAVFVDGDTIELPFLTDDMAPTTISSVEGLFHQLTRLDKIEAKAQVSKFTDIVPVNNTLYTIRINGETIEYLSDSNATIEDIVTALKQKIVLNDNIMRAVDVTIANDEIIVTSKVPGQPFTASALPYFNVTKLENSCIIDTIRVSEYTRYDAIIEIDEEPTICSYTSSNNTSAEDIAAGLANKISYELSDSVEVIVRGTEILIELTDIDKKLEVYPAGNIKAAIVTENVETDFVESAFNKKLEHTQIMVVPSMPMGLLRIYDLTGEASNLERIVLHVDLNSANNADPAFYWGKTTSAFKVLASRAGDIVKLGNEIDNLIALASNIHKVMDVQDSLDMLTDGKITIYSKLSVLQTIYDSLHQVGVIYDDLMDSVKGSSINRVSDDLDADDSKIKEVANDLQDSLSKVKEVANNLQETESTVTIVGEDLYDTNSKIRTLADDLQDSMSKIRTIYTDMVSVDSAIKEVADNLQLGLTSDIKILSTDIQLGTNSNILTISKDLQSDDDSRLKLISNDLWSGDDSKLINIDSAIRDPNSSINKADDYALEAKGYKDETAILKSQAEDAKDSAEAARDVAITKSDEIKNVSVGNTQTVANGNPASVTYNANTGKFSFVIPQGPKGEDFSIDANGNTDDKAQYDDEPKGFSFLDTETSKLYFKRSNDTGDWSDGVIFGKGDTGNGIDRIERTAGDGSPGTDDTYTIYMTNGTTFDFKVHNGANIVFGKDVENVIEEMALIMY